MSAIDFIICGIGPIRGRREDTDGMVTITDVSKRAGVSRSTVSRVVAGNGYVSESKRKAIEGAIADLGYRPNTMAQALRSNRSNLIGAVMVDGARPAPHGPPPVLGADNASVWTELGLSPAELAALKDEGVI